MDDQRGFHEQPQPKHHAGYGSRGRSPACLMRLRFAPIVDEDRQNVGNSDCVDIPHLALRCVFFRDILP
jgi:hypothetical protein